MPTEWLADQTPHQRGDLRSIKDHSGRTHPDQPDPTRSFGSSPFDSNDHATRRITPSTATPGRPTPRRSQSIDPFGTNQSRVTHDPWRQILQCPSIPSTSRYSHPFRTNETPTLQIWQPDPRRQPRSSTIPSVRSPFAPNESSPARNTRHRSTSDIPSERTRTQSGESRGETARHAPIPS